MAVKSTFLAKTILISNTVILIAQVLNEKLKSIIFNFYFSKTIVFYCIRLKFRITKGIKIFYYIKDFFKLITSKK